MVSAWVGRYGGKGVRSFVPAKFGSEPLVLFAEVLILLFKLLNTIFERKKFLTRNLNAVI